MRIQRCTNHLRICIWNSENFRPL